MSERIRKLAKKYNRSVEDVVAALASFGETRYRQAEDLIPDALLGPLDKAIRKLPVAKPVIAAKPTRFEPALDRGGRSEVLPQNIPDNPGLNAALQEYLAAAPLADLKKSLGEKTKAAPAQATQPPSTEAILRESLGAEIHRRRLAEDALAEMRQEHLKALSFRQESLFGTQQALTQALAERERLLKQLEDLDSRCVLAQKALELEQQRSAGLQQQLDATRSDVEQQQVKLDSLHAQLQAELATRLALEAKLSVGSTAQAPVAKPSAGSTDVPALKSPLFPSAPSAHVETTSNREKAVREFLQVCRDKGIVMLNIVGGSPKYWQELQGLLPGLELRCVDGTAGMDQARARRQVEGADVTLIWGSSILSHRVSACYTELKNPSVLVIHHRGLEGLLRDAAEAISRMPAST